MIMVEENPQSTKTQSSLGTIVSSGSFKTKVLKLLITIASSLILFSMTVHKWYGYFEKYMSGMTKMELVYALDIIVYFIYIILGPVIIYQLSQICPNTLFKKCEAPPSLWILLSTFTLRLAAIIFQIKGSNVKDGFRIIYLFNLILILMEVIMMFTPMLMLGSIVSNFKKLCINPAKTKYIENCQELLAVYKSIKSQSQLGLFLVFTCFTCDLILFGFMGLASFQGCHNIDIFFVLCFCGSLIGCLTYYAFLAQS